MRVYVLWARESVDVSGQVMESAFVREVFSSREAAETERDSIKDSYMRKKWEFDIDEFEVQ